MIEFVGASVANAASITIPTHQAGDLIVCFTFRDGSTTNPSIPTGVNWTSITSTLDGTTCSSSAAWKEAASAAEASGTWTNASGIAVAVFRGARRFTDGVLPIGTFQSSAGATNTLTFAALSTFKAPTSWLLAFAGHRSVDVTLETPPTDLANAANGAGATCEMSVHHSNGVYKAADSWPSTNVALSGTASGWISMILEIRAPALVVQNYLAARSRGLSVSERIR